MGRESIEEGELSSPLVAKESHEAYTTGAGSGGGGDGGGEGQSVSASATGAVVLSTLVAVSGSYVFGSAVSALDLSFRRVLYTVFSGRHFTKGPHDGPHGPRAVPRSVHMVHVRVSGISSGTLQNSCIFYKM